ncbi:MAG: hypothetical protein AABX04_01835, partial [Nanoarchaeota archaeon]
MDNKKIFLLTLGLALMGLFAFAASATVNLIYPADNAWISANFSQGLGFVYNYTGPAVNTSGVGAVNCTLWMLEGPSEIVNRSLTIANNTNFNASNSSYPIPSGRNTWNVTCTNVTGLYSENSTTYTFNYDPTSMGINLVTPTNYTWNNSATPVFAFKFNDTLSL